MNWEAVGAIGETLSAVAVLITLGYLALQFRQNTRTMRSSALRSMQDVVLLTEGNERYIAYLMKSQRNEELTPEERAHVVMTIMRTFERIWHEHTLGVIAEHQFNQHLDLLRWAMSMPEPRCMWEQMAQIFDPQFRAVVDAQALSGDAPTSSMVKAFLALGTLSK
jgi:hypothetical protein